MRNFWMTALLIFALVVQVLEFLLLIALTPRNEYRIFGRFLHKLLKVLLTPVAWVIGVVGLAMTWVFHKIVQKGKLVP